jgi:uncharacterized cupin superfamily protein
MNHLIAFRDYQIEPAINTPFFAELLSGNPTTTAWRIATTDDGQVSSGFWSATPAKWRMDYKVWEFCQILEGTCVLTPDGSLPQEFGPGDTFVCEPGLCGTWEVTSSLRKAFVVRKV